MLNKFAGKMPALRNLVIKSPELRGSVLSVVWREGMEPGRTGNLAGDDEIRNS
jgi:hypothetical protein